MNPLIDRVARNTGITKKLAHLVIEEVFSSIVHLAHTEGKLTIREFGRFEIKRRKARINRTPIQGESSHIPAREMLTFYCSPALTRNVEEE